MKKFFIALLAIACAGVLIFAGAYCFWLKTETDGLRRVQGLIQERGLPATAGDFFPRLPPDDRNAAVYLQKAAALVKAMPDETLSFRCSPGADSDKSNTASLPETQLEEIRVFLRDPATTEVVRLLMEAAAKDECYFARDYAKGVSLELPDVAPMIRAVRLLLNHAWVLAADGHVGVATEEIRAALRISEFYMRDPLLITWLVGVSCERMALSALMCLLETTAAPSPPLLERLEATMRDHRAAVRSDLVRAFDGERVFFGGSIFQMLLSGKSRLYEMLPAFGLGGQDARVGTGTLWIYQFLLRPLLMADYATYLRFMLAARKEVVEGPHPGRGSNMLSAEIPRSALLTRLAAPALEPTIVKMQEIETSLDLALIGLQAEIFRMRNGYYPGSLVEIPSEARLPRDPFSGSDFIYTVTDGDLLIYSIGPDLVDNHGNPKRVGKERDIIWSVRRSSLHTGSN